MVKKRLVQFCFAIFFLVSPVFLPILKLVFGHIARYAPSNKLQNSLKIQTKNCTTYYFTIAKQEVITNVKVGYKYALR